MTDKASIKTRFPREVASWRRNVAPAVALVVGVAISTTLFLAVRYWLREQRLAEFDRRTANVEAALGRGIDHYVTSVQAIKNVTWMTLRARQQSGEPDLTNSAAALRDWQGIKVMFRQTVLDAQVQLPAIQAQGWVSHFPGAERIRNEAMARMLVSPDYRLHEFDEEYQAVRAADRDWHFPIFYLEPIEEVRDFLGFDLASSPKCLRALTLARDTGRITATAPLKWFAEVMGQPGFLIFAPIYTKEEPLASVQERRENFYSFAMGAVTIGDMVETSLTGIDTGGIDYFLFPQLDSPQADSLYGRPAYLSTADPDSFDERMREALAAGVDRSAELQVADREWSLLFLPRPEFFAHRQAALPWLVLAAGLLITLLTGLSLHRSLGRTAYVERLVAERTAELSQSNEELAREIAVRKQAEEEQKRLEGQLRQSQKMEAIGTLAGGIAHDFNNLLGGIIGYTDMLKLGALAPAEAAKAISVIEKTAERASQLTRQLLGFARKGKLQNVGIDLNETVREVISLLERTIDKKITIERALNAASPFTTGDPGQMQQAILNLAINASDAMSEGGRLVFESRIVDLDEAYCARIVHATPGRYVMISVSDTGPGIPAEIQDRIFEPFFTTKNRGQGSGMGLAMVYGIVKNHGGHIEVYSECPGGTIFKVYLPHTEALRPAPEPTESAKPISGHGRVLVVDDEEVVRRMATDMLIALGYEVIAAADGAEAVELYAENPEQIDLVLLDLVMPNLGGRECFRAMKEIDPTVKAILSTGYARDGAPQEILNEGMAGFVQKPYRMRELSEVVASALGRR